MRSWVSTLITMTCIGCRTHLRSLMMEFGEVIYLAAAVCWRLSIGCEGLERWASTPPRKDGNMAKDLSLEFQGLYHQRSMLQENVFFLLKPSYRKEVTPTLIRRSAAPAENDCRLLVGDRNDDFRHSIGTRRVKPVLMQRMSKFGVHG